MQNIEDLGVHPDNVDMTKSRRLSQFFTNRTLSKQLVKTTMDLLRSQNHVMSQMHFIEPSAGDGAFYDYLPPERRVGIEIDPSLVQRHPEYRYETLESGGFLHTSKESLGFEHIPNSCIVVIGNPPYSQPRTRGRSKNIAFEFLEHAFSMANTVAMILGVTFRRPRTLDKLNPYFHLIWDQDIPHCSYTLDGKPATVRTVFQIWQKRPVQRPKDPTLLWSKKGNWPLTDWFYVKATDPRANVRIRQWGSHARVGQLTPLHEVTPKVHENQQKVQDRAAEGLSITGYNPDRSFYYLCARDPAQVQEAFAQRRHLFYQVAQDRSIGNHPDLTKLDLVRIYLQPVTAQYENGRYISNGVDPNH